VHGENTPVPRAERRGNRLPGPASAPGSTTANIAKAAARIATARRLNDVAVAGKTPFGPRAAPSPNAISLSQLSRPSAPSTRSATNWSLWWRDISEPGYGTQLLLQVPDTHSRACGCSEAAVGSPVILTKTQPGPSAKCRSVLVVRVALVGLRSARSVRYASRPAVGLNAAPLWKLER
jgi:hypothetical protein